jgi:hypothetical protein
MVSVSEAAAFRCALRCAESECLVTTVRVRLQRLRAIEEITPRLPNMIRTVRAIIAETSLLVDQPKRLLETPGDEVKKNYFCCAVNR